ncbi:MAG: class I SAM-dependent methyltransferase [Defluviitaleaceae bacterium]|nr:class I SAM-dependent methyltransferase [Defluviitaleaceae bacterium]
MEIPIAVINDTNVFPTLASLDFNSARFNDRHDYKADVNVYMDNYRRFFDSFFKTFGTDAIASVVMHSWSFFQRAEDETYSVINPLAPKMFENLLLEYSKKFDIITVSDISQQINSQKFSNIIIPMPQGENLKMECPICGWTGKTFNPYNGRNNAECPICYSLERHRHLWLYYNYSQLLEIAVPKKVLIFAPSGSIISKLRRYKNLELVTADINPKRAEHQVDVQAIPFEDESFDFIECFFVLPYVEDDVKALNELHRVLKTNGKIALYLPIRAISEGSIDLYAVDTPFTETERKNNPGFRHVYGSDVLNWLALPGFNAQRIDNIVTYSPDELKRYGINSSSSIFILEKIKTTKNTDRIAEAYHGAMGENLCRATRDRIHWICERAIGENILDVGCSQGITTILLAREGKRVVGVDICQQGIDYAQQSLKNENKTTREYIKFLCTDFVSYAKKCNKKFDSIIMGEVLEHLTEPERFISKAYTILCDGGRLVATVPFGINNYHDHKRTYYLTAFYNLFIDKFTITEIKFLGDWIGIVGVKVKAEGIKLDSALFMQAEEAFMIREKELRRM